MVEFIARRFTSANEFLNALRLSDPEWWTYKPLTSEPDRDWQRDWIFRGESSTKEWTPLVPAAWRTKPEPSSLVRTKQEILRNARFLSRLQETVGKRGFYSILGPLADEDQTRQRQRMADTVLQGFGETLLINEFTDLADELGFKVYELPNWTRRLTFASKYVSLTFPPTNIIVEETDTSTVEAPTPEQEDEEETPLLWTHPTVALAQHHNIPTRLLDWTRNPLAAAYFAAIGAPKRDPSDEIAIYCMNRAMLSYHIKVVSIASSQNEYLRAQRGIFTLDTKGDEFYLMYGRRLGLEESIRFLPAAFNSIYHPRKLTLPVTEAPELLRLLWLERVTQAHLMPTLDNVASAVALKLEMNAKLGGIQQQ